MRHPDGITLIQLPDGRTLVRDDRVPASHEVIHRWTVLRAGWQQTVRDWGRDATGYLGWWSAVVMSGCVDDVSADDVAGLVRRFGRDG